MNEIELLRTLVNINSDSYNTEGLEKVLCSIKTACGPALRIKTERKNGHPFMVIENDPSDTKRSFALVGHIDTVFPENFAPFSMSGTMMRGPGVEDMKSGIVMMLSLMRSFAGSRNLKLRALINSDEETGSKDSLGFLRKYTKDIDAAFVFEGVTEKQGIIVKRKGITEVLVEAQGKAAHAGTYFDKGVNAIAKLFHVYGNLKNDRFFKKEGVSLNLARINGGGKLNIVPDRAHMWFDFRSFSTSDFLNMRKRFARARTGGIKMTVYDKRPPLPGGKTGKYSAILKMEYEKAGETFSLDSTGGASDANFISTFGIPVLDGLGPRGGGDHTEKEFTLLGSFKKRLSAFRAFLEYFEKK